MYCSLQRVAIFFFFIRNKLYPLSFLSSESKDFTCILLRQFYSIVITGILFETRDSLIISKYKNHCKYLIAGNYDNKKTEIFHASLENVIDIISRVFFA